MNPWLGLVGVAWYLATIRFLDGRHPLTHSFAGNTMFAFEWAQQVRAGVLYPHWLEHSFAGLGSPTFHFYGPLCMYAVLPFTLLFKLPFTTSVLAGSMLAMLVLGLGVARLTAVLCGPRPRWLQGVAGALSVLAPYVWIDAYVRGAIGELWGMAVIPWLLAALFRSVGSQQPRDRIGVVVTTAVLGLCHPPVFLMAASSIGLSMLLTSNRFGELVTWFRRGMLPMLVGVLLDGFYLASAIFDQRYVNIDYLNHDAGGLPNNHLLAGELGHLSSKMAEGFEGNMIPGFLAGAVAVVWAARLIWRRGHPEGPNRGRHAVFLIVLAIVSAFMMTDLAKGVYALLPVFNRIQFAYRWLSVYSIAAVALWGLVLAMMNAASESGRGIPRAACWVAVLGVATLSFGTMSPQISSDEAVRSRIEGLLASVHGPDDFGDPAAGPKEVSWGGGLLNADASGKLLYLDLVEYMPLTKANAGFPPRRFEPVEWASGQGTVSNVSWRTGYRHFDVDSPGGGEVLVRTTAWLGWRVEVNGVSSVGDKAGNEGRMRIAVPPGHSKVTIRYAGTPNQRRGDALSLVTLILLIGAIFLRRPPTQPSGLPSPTGR